MASLDFDHLFDDDMIDATRYALKAFGFERTLVHVDCRPCHGTGFSIIVSRPPLPPLSLVCNECGGSGVRDKFMNRNDPYEGDVL